MNFLIQFVDSIGNQNYFVVANSYSEAIRNIPDLITLNQISVLPNLPVIGNTEQYNPVYLVTMQDNTTFFLVSKSFDDAYIFVKDNYGSNIYAIQGTGKIYY